MPFRFLAIEAYVDSDRVQMQLLNAHQSVSAAYWHYPPHPTRLFLIDLSKGTTHSWQECEIMMYAEQLERVSEDKQITPVIRQALHAADYIGSDGGITNKGREFLAQYHKKPLSIIVAHIASQSKLHLG